MLFSAFDKAFLDKTPLHSPPLFSFDQCSIIRADPALILAKSFSCPSLVLGIFAPPARL